MPLRIAHVTSEFGNLAQTGGLADAVAALTGELAGLGHDVRVFLPLYGVIDTAPLEIEPERALAEIVVPIGAVEYTLSVCSWQPPGGGPLVYLLDCPTAYRRQAIYDNRGDEHARFALLARAALEVCQRLKWAPQVLHCHDWHAGLAPLYLDTIYRWDPLFAGTRTMLTIHNLSYQGVFPCTLAEDLSLTPEAAVARDDGRSKELNFLATGIRHADLISTVSPTYAREILTAEHGAGLEDLLSERRDDLVGILNGVDYQQWDPKHDPYLPVNYSATDLAGKSVCRRELLAELGLDADPHGPVLGIVSRLAWQKGMDAAAAVLTELLGEEDMRLVVLGTGEEELEALFAELAASFPRSAAFRGEFDPALAHRIEAGSDVFLMPSRFEPCGLNQMYSLRYGTPPVVHGVGGLADTVEGFDAESGEGTGFLFRPFGIVGLRGALETALAIFRRPELWKRLMANGMAKDFSWSRQVEDYIAAYERLTGEAEVEGTAGLGEE